MGLTKKFAVLLVCQLTGTALAFAQSPRPRDTAAEIPGAVPVGPITSVPAGWLDFCARYPGECVGGSWFAADIELDKQTRAKIERINKWVNDTIEPVSDAEARGVADQWDYPIGGKGDCEDFALLKRRLLAAEDLPLRALLLTVVKDSRNDGHAVLMVKTTSGDFVLDNLNDEMKPWDQTGYRFVKRQSQSDPNRWVQLGEPTSSPEFVSR